LTKEEKMQRAAEIDEWLRFLAQARRFGSKNPAAVADVLVYGEEQALDDRG
jgi:hypothetical protein